MSLVEEAIKQKQKQEFINNLKLGIAEEYPLPPKPIKTQYIFYDLIDLPTNNEAKVALTVASSTLAGAFIGATRAWFFDYKKVPNIKYMQSLLVNAKYIKGPTLLASVIGTAWATSDYAFSRYNRTSVKPFGVEKDQSLTQQFWKATLAGASSGIITGSPALTVQAGVGAGVIYLYYAYMNQKGGWLSRQKKMRDERVAVASDPLKYKPIDANYKMQENRVQYGFYFEDRTDKPSRGTCSNIEYVEE